MMLYRLLFVEQYRDPESLMRDIVAQLTDDLRRPPYKGNKNPLTGHCYVASEALYHLLGSKDWLPCNIQHEGSPHWYLKNKVTGEVLDPTAGQFDTPVPYSQGRGKGFLTKQRCKRAAELLRRLNANN